MAGIDLTVKLSGHDVLEELTARDQVEHQVVEVLLGNALVEAHDVRVLELAADLGLALQLLVVALVQLLCVDDLGGELDLGGLVHAALDDGEGALAQLLLQVILVGEASANDQCHLSNLLARKRKATESTAERYGDPVSGRRRFGEQMRFSFCGAMTAKEKFGGDSALLVSRINLDEYTLMPEYN